MRKMINKLKNDNRIFRDNNVYNYKLYTGMREQNFNIVKYIEDILYIFNLLIDNK